MVTVRAVKRPNKFQIFINKIKRSELYILIRIFIFSIFIVVTLSILFGTYSDPDTINNILIEAHGLLFDILILGLLFTFLMVKVKNRLKTDRLKDEIDDFRNWVSEEAAFRINGIISRLNKLKYTCIDLSHCFLSNIEIKQKYLNNSNMVNTNLSSSKLIGLNITNSCLIQTNFQNAWFLGGSIKNSICHEANFKNTKLYNINLQDSDFTDAEFNNADFDQANLKGAILTRAKLEGAINLTKEQLFEVETLWDAEIDKELFLKIKDHKHLFKKPKNE